MQKVGVKCEVRTDAAGAAVEHMLCGHKSCQRTFAKFHIA